MRDPRLIEIELLAEIDRATWTEEQWTYQRPAVMGGHERQRHDALLHMAFEGAIIGADGYRPSNYAKGPDLHPNPTYAIDAAAKELVARILADHIVKVRITQRGRLRLYRLRDEMLNKDRLREPFGVLWDKRHFSPDLEVRLRLHDFPKPFSLLLLDVDRLKALNSKLGHVGADDVLRGIFQALQDVVQPHDAYRLGGDEAGAILPGVPLDQAVAFAEKVREAVAHEFRAKVIDDEGSTPTVSIGVGTTAASMPARALTEAVDALTERAKSTGKNNVVSAAIGALGNSGA